MEPRKSEDKINLGTEYKLRFGETTLTLEVLFASSILRCPSVQVGV